jgi:flavodoxin
MPLNYHDNFDQSGKFSVRSGNTDSMAQMLRDVLGDGYEVTVGNREILLKIKDGKENTKPE